MIVCWSTQEVTSSDYAVMYELSSHRQDMKLPIEDCTTSGHRASCVRIQEHVEGPKKVSAVCQ